MFQQLEQDPGPAASALKTSIFRLGCVQAARGIGRATSRA
ncbi:hypothetical protein ACMYR2_1235 [Nitrobacter sp. TKz-YC01]